MATPPVKPGLKSSAGRPPSSQSKTVAKGVAKYGQITLFFISLLIFYFIVLLFGYCNIITHTHNYYLLQ